MKFKIYLRIQIPPNTIFSILDGIQRHIREESRHPDINLFNGIAFFKFMGNFGCCNEKKTVLEGMGGVKHTENLTNNDDNEL